MCPEVVEIVNMDGILTRRMSLVPIIITMCFGAIILIAFSAFSILFPGRHKSVGPPGENNKVLILRHNITGIEAYFVH